MGRSYFATALKSCRVQLWRWVVWIVGQVQSLALRGGEELGTQTANLGRRVSFITRAGASRSKTVYDKALYGAVLQDVKGSGEAQTSLQGILPRDSLISEVVKSSGGLGPSPASNSLLLKP
jgi:hypothetical protein